MKLCQKLHQLFEDRARNIEIECISIGLGYTAVTTSQGGIGIAYTYFENKQSCSLLSDADFEGKTAPELLEKLSGSNTIQRSVALAFVNALNYESALSLPEDPGNEILFDTFDIRKGTRVAMVGFFGPLIKKFKEKEASLEILDASRGMGHKENFYARLRQWTEVLFLTSTSILNQTTEEIFTHVGPKVKTVMLGPSTPMVAEAFDHLPVHMLAGTVPLDKAKVLQAVRHGLGTPVIQRFSRKVYLNLVK